MNTKELVTKAIREGLKYVDETPVERIKKHEAEDIDRMASTLSSGLVTLTEEELKGLLVDAVIRGSAIIDKVPSHTNEIAECYAARIMREVKEGNDG